MLIFVFFHRVRKEETRTIVEIPKLSKALPNFTNTTTRTASVSATWSTETYTLIYGLIMASLFVVALTRSVSFFNFCATASKNLHDSMFRGLVSTRMRFFDVNPSGRIMNRFSKDMGSTDEALPKSCLDAGQINLGMLGAILVTIFTNFKFSIVILIMGAFFLITRHIYLKSSTNIKRLEGTSKSF